MWIALGNTWKGKLLVVLSAAPCRISVTVRASAVATIGIFRQVKKPKTRMVFTSQNLKKLAAILLFYKNQNYVRMCKFIKRQIRETVQGRSVCWGAFEDTGTSEERLFLLEVKSPASPPAPADPW